MVSTRLLDRVTGEAVRMAARLARLLDRLVGARLLSSQANAEGCWLRLRLVDDGCVFFPPRWEEEAGVLALAVENCTSHNRGFTTVTIFKMTLK